MTNDKSFMETSRWYFDSRRKSYLHTHSGHCAADWRMVLQIVKAIYNVHYVYELPRERDSEINRLAIQITENLFDAMNSKNVLSLCEMPKQLKEQEDTKC